MNECRMSDVGEPIASESTYPVFIVALYKSESQSKQKNQQNRTTHIDMVSVPLSQATKTTTWTPTQLPP